MKPIVLDCSVPLSWCFADEANAYGDSALDYCRKNGAIVPGIWPLEITNSLLSAEKRKRIDKDSILIFLQLLARLPIRVIQLPTRDIFTQVLKLASDQKLTTYDASYLFLAMREKAPLATLDEALRRASRRQKLPRARR